MTSRFEKWNTPFSEVIYPSLGNVQMSGDDGAVECLVTNEDLSWRVSFNTAVACRVGFESCGINFANLGEGDLTDGCTFLWHHSSWREEFLSQEPSVDAMFGDGSSIRLAHYVLFGADLILEVLAVDEPSILAMGVTG